MLLKNTINKGLLFLLSSTLLLGSVPAFSVFALENDNSEKLGKIVYNEEFYNNNKEVCDYVNDCMQQHMARIDISNYNVEIDDLRDLFFSVYMTNPKLFFVDSAYAYSIRNGKAVAIVPKYFYDEEETKQKQEEIDEKTKEALSYINDSMTDFEKAIALHDYIVLNCQYRLDKVNGATTIYDCLVDGSSTCMGYTSTYSYLLSLAGVDSEYVESDPMVHAWNKVKIDGEYYNVDCTWDDPLSDKFGHITHTYFMCSDDQFQNNSAMRKHYSYTISNDATSTKFDNMYIKSVSNTLCFVNGSCYTIAPSTSKIVEINTEDGSYKSDLLKLKNYWYVIDKPGYYWNNSYYSIDTFDGKLYYSTEKDVFMYDFESGESVLIAGDVNTENVNYIYGMHILNNGDVVVALKDTPNNNDNLIMKTVATLEKTEVTEPDYLIGDVDGDGIVSVDDVTFIQMYVAFMCEFDEEQLVVADFNNDDIINIFDATAIQYSIAQ